MFMDLKNYIDAKNPTNLNRIPCTPKVIQFFLVQLFYLIQVMTPVWDQAL